MATLLPQPRSQMPMPFSGYLLCDVKTPVFRRAAAKQKKVKALTPEMNQPEGVKVMPKATMIKNACPASWLRGFLAAWKKERTGET